MKIIRVAIIGQGRSGRDIHARTLQNMPERYRLVAVTDPLPDRRQRAREEFACEVLHDHRELYQRRDLDLVVNTTPNHLHVPITRKILEAGFHVLCEKPLASTVKEIDLLVETARKTGKILAVFQQGRYEPYWQCVERVVDSGVLGRLVQVDIAWNEFVRRWDWQTLRKYGAGNLLNLGSHALDHALHLIGAEVMPQVVCFMDRVNCAGDAEDYVKLVLRSKGCPVVDIEVSNCCAYLGPVCQIQAANGGLRASAGQVDWKYFKPEENPAQALSEAPINNAAGRPMYCSEKLKWHEEIWKPARDAVPATTAFFIALHRTLTENAPLEVTLEQVRMQTAIIEAAHQQNQ